MKKVLFIFSLMFILCDVVYAEETPKVKVYMFSMSNVSNTQIVIDEIKKYNGYGKDFELIVLESCILNGNGPGKDIYTDNQKILDKLFDHYNEYTGEDNSSRQYPTFLVGKDFHTGSEGLYNIIQRNIKNKDYNDNVYECIINNENTNCFGEIKKDKKNSIFKIILITIGLSSVIFFIVAFKFVLK